MEKNHRISIAQRLAIEKQLLGEEKYIVQALKAIKEERFALQREATDLFCLLSEVLRQGKHRDPQNKEVDMTHSLTTEVQETELDNTTSSLSEFNIPAFDEVVGNDVELNLTVPSHHFSGEYQGPEEEYDEMDMEDDFEIEMSMLMNGEKANE